MKDIYIRVKYFLIASSVALVISGCASTGEIKLMEEIKPSPTSTSPQNGKSTIVFFRPEDNLSKMHSEVIDVTKNDFNIVGVLASTTRVIYNVDPGEYRFMSIGAGSFTEFMTANLVQKSTYYVYVKAWTNGLGASRYYLIPMTNEDLSNPDVEMMIKKTRLVQKNSKTEEWLKNNITNVRQRASSYNQAVNKGSVPHLK